MTITPHTIPALHANRRSPSRFDTDFSQTLQRLIDFGLAAIIIAAPFFMGGLGPIGKFVFVAMVGFVAVSWGLRQCLVKKSRWRWSGAEVLIIAGMLAPLLQLAPLSPDWLERLSPHTAALLPLWTEHSQTLGQTGPWSTISLTPQMTRESLAVYIAYAMLFLVVVQRIRSLEDVERILRWIAWVAVGMAVLGLAQFLFGNGRFLWVYEHPSRDTYHQVKGAFANQNHFAHFLALGTAPLIWLLVRLQQQASSETEAGAAKGGGHRRSSSGRRRKHKRSDKFRPSNRTLLFALLIGAGVVAFSGLLTFSRGGILVLALAALLCLGLYWWKSILDKKCLLVIGPMLLLVGVALVFYGYEPLTRRLGAALNARSLDELSHGRQELWNADLTAIPQFPLWGSGFGSHREIYRVFMREHFDREFTHAESGYLQILVEGGGASLLLMLAGIGLVLFWCFHAWRRSPTAAYSAAVGAVIPGIVVSVVHSLCDFVWCLSACMSVAIILAACVCRLSQLAASGETAPAGDEPAPRRTKRRSASSADAASGFSFGMLQRPAIALGVFAICAAVSAALLPHAMAAPHYEHYYKLSKMSSPDAVVAEGALPQDATPDQVVMEQTALLKALAHYPQDYRANLRLAAVLLQRFNQEQAASKNPMELVHIRDAAEASRFSSRAAQDKWLAAAVGKRRQLLDRALLHCRRALRMCPLRGTGYVQLAELSFLEGASRRTKAACFSQAIKVRPNNSVVLLAFGREAALAGDPETAFVSFKKAALQNPKTERQLLNTYGPMLPASYILSKLEPSLAGLTHLLKIYRQQGREQDAAHVGGRLVAGLEGQAKTAEPAEAARLWFQVYSIHLFRHDRDRALYSLRKAAELAPDVFIHRRTLALFLMEQEQYDEAIGHLQWCLRRKLADRQLKNLLAAATRKRIEQKVSAGEQLSRRPAPPIR